MAVMLEFGGGLDDVYAFSVKQISHTSESSLMGIQYVQRSTFSAHSALFRALIRPSLTYSDIPTRGTQTTVVN